MNKPEVVLENIANLGEGPVWDSKNSVLYFVDINGCKLLSYDYKNDKCRSAAAPGRISTALLCRTPGALICSIENSLFTFGTENGRFDPFLVNIYEASGNIRFNDGKCDTRGRLYVGTMGAGGKPGGKLFKIDGGKNIEICEENIGISNGLAFDGKYLYYIDTPSGFLWRYDYDIETGNIQNRTALIDYREEPGRFDGMTIDSDGNLWIASWGGHTVSKYDSATGKKLDIIKLPAPNVTSCEFGGEGMDILFITTAGGTNEDMKKDYPLAGSLFAVKTDAKGLECGKFAI